MDLLSLDRLHDLSMYTDAKGFTHAGGDILTNQLPGVNRSSWLEEKSDCGPDLNIRIVESKL